MSANGTGHSNRRECPLLGQVSIVNWQFIYANDPK